ncbi:MAG: hypothetical protein BMS9Abin13_551 [Patescibacteria group bacterium]|nr:MAG: hypothetical protein BMS9Abin13_551 [Patescibacteria group bacterium]
MQENTNKGNKKILIVEDEEPMRMVLADKLTMEGFSVLEAKDGVEGLEIALKDRPDLILLDIIMPRMDGLTMLERLRENECCKDTLVILLTNLGRSDKITKVLEGGNVDFMIKAEWTLKDTIKKIKEKLSETS